MSDHTCEYCQMKYRTPGTIEVPVSEVEAVLRDQIAHNENTESDEEPTRRYVRWASLAELAARLPKPAPDHVAVLEAFLNDHRRWLKNPGSLCPEQLKVRIAALEAAIASLSKEKP